MKIWGLSILLMVNTIVYGQDIFPSGCQPVVLKDETVMLTSKKSTIFLINNNSSTDLWITHPVTEPSASAGWSSRLEAGKWSALALDKNSFELSCVESKPGHEQQIACRDVLMICSWPKLKAPSDATGTFWAAENMKLKPLMAYLGSRGFK